MRVDIDSTEHFLFNIVRKILFLLVVDDLASGTSVDDILSVHVDLPVGAVHDEDARAYYRYTYVVRRRWCAI
jgi:hypothetical protein